jgi:hypothetical protein
MQTNFSELAENSGEAGAGRPRFEKNRRAGVFFWPVAGRFAD